MTEPEKKVVLPTTWGQVLVIEEDGTSHYEGEGEETVEDSQDEADE